MTDKVQLIPGATPTSATFVVSNEDHTLGNSLRYMLMRQSGVLFAGYSVPHPSELKVNFRVQTKGNTTAVDAFKKGLSDLAEVSDIIDAAFDEALARGPEAPPAERRPAAAAAAGGAASSSKSRK